MSKIKEGTRPHMMLETLILKALFRGEVGAKELELNLYDLEAEFEDLSLAERGGKFVPQPNNVILRVKIETSWDTSLELQDLEGTEEEEEHDDRKFPDTDKKSH